MTCAQGCLEGLWSGWSHYLGIRDVPFWDVPRDGVGGAQTQDRPYAALLGVVLRPTTWARADTAIPKPASGAGKPVEHQWFSRQSAGEVLQWRLPDSSASRTAPGNMHRRPQLVDEVTPLRRTDQLNERPGRLGVVGLIVATAPGHGGRGAVVDGGRRLDPLCTACSYSARTWAGGAPFGGARAGSQTRAGTGGSADYRLERLVATGPEHSVLRGGGLSCRRARTRRGRSVGRFRVGQTAVNRPTAHAQS